MQNLNYTTKLIIHERLWIHEHQDAIINKHQPNHSHVDLEFVPKIYNQ